MERPSRNAAELSLQNIRPIIPLDVFAAAQMLGLGYGGAVQCIKTIAAGASFTKNFTVQDGRVYYRTNMIVSVRDVSSGLTILGDAVTYTFTADDKTPQEETNLLFQYGWLEQIFCPPGWTKMTKNFQFAFTNQTGNATYNVLSPQSINLRMTCLLFILDAKYAETFNNIFQDLLNKIQEQV